MLGMHRLGAWSAQRLWKCEYRLEKISAIGHALEHVVHLENERV